MTSNKILLTIPDRKKIFHRTSCDKYHLCACLINAIMLIKGTYRTKYTEKSNDLIQSNDSFVPEKPCDICDEFPFINS